MEWRIDDIGASTKHFNQYGRKKFYHRGKPYFYFPLANLWFFKRIWPFKMWGKYNELTAPEWQACIEVFLSHGIRPIIAITAAWVDEQSQLIPFPIKFPELAAVLKNAYHNNNITIANHGLTHCVVGQHRPRFFSSNRHFHREFWPDLDYDLHVYHIQQSQQILESYFGKAIEVFVPPGNIWSVKTYRALLQTNIKTVSCNRYMMDSNEPMTRVRFSDDTIDCVVLHDKDLLKNGAARLDSIIKTYNHKK